MTPKMLRWVLGVSFIAMVIWTLIPEKFDELDAKLAKYGVFGTTLIAFFLAEMGDRPRRRPLHNAIPYSM
jgi:putative Ca2+/H+ antiporter (TMEM165/GDT1 family)